MFIYDIIFIIIHTSPFKSITDENYSYSPLPPSSSLFSALLFVSKPHWKRFIYLRNRYHWRQLNFRRCGLITFPHLPEKPKYLYPPPKYHWCFWNYHCYWHNWWWKAIIRSSMGKIKSEDLPKYQQHIYSLPNTHSFWWINDNHFYRSYNWRSSVGGFWNNLWWYNSRCVQVWRSGIQNKPNNYTFCWD